MEAVREYWDRVADEYEEHHKGSKHSVHFQRFTYALHWIPRGKKTRRVLNIWSRNGEGAKFFRSALPDMFLVNMEVSSRMLEIARNTYLDELFMRTDLYRLPFSDQAFDIVISLETLEHVPYPLAFIRELYRVTAEGGRVILSCPPAMAQFALRVYETLFPNHGEGPHRFLPSRIVKGLLSEAGFEIIHHEGTVLLPIGPHWLTAAAESLMRRLQKTFFREWGIRQFFIASKPSRRLLRDRSIV